MKKEICYIVSAMSVPDLSQLERTGNLLIAADAGYDTLCKQGIDPDIVVGDFDSLGKVPDHPAVIRHPVEKDDTDTLLAARIGIERGYRKFVFLGALGGFLDHTFANLQTLLWLNEQGAEGLMIGEGQCAATVPGGGCIRFSPENRGRISVFSAGDRADGVTVSGLKYELDRGELRNHFPLGVSNSFVGKEAFVSVRTGSLFVIWQQEERISLQRMMNGDLY